MAISTFGELKRGPVLTDLNRTKPTLQLFASSSSVALSARRPRASSCCRGVSLGERPMCCPRVRSVAALGRASANQVALRFGRSVQPAHVVLRGLCAGIIPYSAPLHTGYAAPTAAPGSDTTPAHSPSAALSPATPAGPTSPSGGAPSR